MKQELSKREKLLIYSAVLLVLIYLTIQFGVLPLLSGYNEGVRERDRLTAEMFEVQTDIANKSATIEANENAIERLENVMREYPFLVYNDEIDVELTSLCNTVGLTPTALRFTDRISIYPPPTGTDRNEYRPPVLTVVNVSMNVTGSYNSLMQLFDEVDKIQHMRIVSMSYSESRGVETGIIGSIILAFELTYVNP